MIYYVFYESFLLGTNLYFLIRRILINEISNHMNLSIKPDVKLTVHIDVFSSFSSIHLSKYVLAGYYDSHFF
jgi:hypothetical protein